MSYDPDKLADGGGAAVALLIVLWLPFIIQWLEEKTKGGKK